MGIKCDMQSLSDVLGKLNENLSNRYSSDGCWRGHLSNSALSTAVGLFTLAQVDSDRHKDIIRTGLLWLRDNANEDGGWGDTVISKSNLSTTLLVWAALGVAEDFEIDVAVSTKSAEIWIENSIGSLEPDKIRAAIVDYYGKDKTFAVPILAMLTIAGRLGPLPDVWRHVSQLPFELSVLPQSFFRWLRLPVVSYALPALIAIGVVRHVLSPSKNIVSRAIRNIILARALNVLQGIQPANGGFLEATPLTGFVVMSLAAAGYGNCQVVERGIQFLAESAREDGGWPIDTDLAIWVTTLAVNASDIENDFTAEKREAIRSWLLSQQFKQKHSFTGAEPGGWAWTDLAGGVPDADDTAGALLALKKLSATDDLEAKHAATAGLNWLLGLQNSDGGVPTFCKGWGILPFDMSCPDITAHAIHAISVWESDMDEKTRQRLGRARRRMLRYLEKTQNKDGSWIPLWFGNEQASGGKSGSAGDGENPVYGTARVLAGIDAGVEMARSGCKFLCDVQNNDGGWGGDAGVVSSVEETALAVVALSEFDNDDCSNAVKRGINWLIENIEDVGKIEATPIGLYFASLWYYEDMYPLVFAIEALNNGQ